MDRGLFASPEKVEKASASRVPLAEMSESDIQYILGRRCPHLKTIVSKLQAWGQKPQGAMARHLLIWRRQALPHRVKPVPEMKAAVDEASMTATDTC